MTLLERLRGLYQYDKMESVSNSAQLMGLTAAECELVAGGILNDPPIGE